MLLGPGGRPAIVQAGGAHVLDEPPGDHDVGTLFLVGAGALRIGNRVLAEVRGLPASFTFLAAGTNLDEWINAGNGGETATTTAAVAEKETLSNCAWHKVPFLTLHTARPAYTLAFMATVVVPDCVQLVPSAETQEVKTFPARTSRNQYGAARPVDEVTPEADAPVPLRCWRAVPFAGVMKLMTYRELGSNVSRIITPALAQPAVFCIFSTRAVMEQSPVRA